MTGLAWRADHAASRVSSDGWFRQWNAPMQIGNVESHGSSQPRAHQAATRCTSSSGPLTC